MSDAQNQPLKAAVWMLGAVFGFSSMAVLARKLVVDLDTFEIMAYRSAFGLLAVLVVSGIAGTAHQIRATAMPLHFGRNIAHFTGQNLWLFAAPLIPLSQLFALEFAYPIIVAICASIFLGERLTRIRVITAALGFAGIMTVAATLRGGRSLYRNTCGHRLRFRLCGLCVVYQKAHPPRRWNRHQRPVLAVGDAACLRHSMRHGRR